MKKDKKKDKKNNTVSKKVQAMESGKNYFENTNKDEKKSSNNE